MIRYKIWKEDSAETEACKIACNALERVLEDVPLGERLNCDECGSIRANVISAIMDIVATGIDLE